MSKPLLLFRGPVKSRSGYGAHSRDVLECLYKMDKYDIKVDSCNWGSTPLTALESDNEFHKWITSNIVVTLTTQPDIYVQVTVANEFTPLGKYNIGITAGIESTIIPRDWIDGCNRMDIVITTSEFSKNVITNTVYNEINQNTGSIIRTHKVEKPVYVLFEGLDLDVYNKEAFNPNSNISKMLDSLDTDFNFLFVGHWLDGRIGQDRKDVGMLIRTFSEAFSGDTKTSLILKTSYATFSVKERERLKTKIKECTDGIQNPPQIHLLFGDLHDNEMNDLYNHPKIKSMVSLTKGEGFGRPLLEFTTTGKPLITTNWSGHKDFLPEDKSILVGGQLTDIDTSASNKFLLKEAKWFTANYPEFIGTIKLVKKNYDGFLTNSEKLRIENINKFSMDKMKEKFQDILNENYTYGEIQELILPELIKI